MDSVKKNFYLAPDLKKVRTKQAHIAYEAKPQVIRLLKNDLKKKLMEYLLYLLSL